MTLGTAPPLALLPRWSRRRWLMTAASTAAVGGLAAVPEVRLLAGQLQDFVVGPPVPDIAPEQISEHVWMIYASDGFPTPQNQGMMANVVFVVTDAGVVVLDSGGSLQIGEMAIRMIRTVTDQPVVAVFISHYHGDHWLGNHAFMNAYGPDLPIYSLAHNIEQIRGFEGNLWRSLMERWTNQATLGTRVVAPNRAVQHGQVFTFGQVTLKMHFYGQAHTPSDLSIEVLPDRVTYVGDVAMDNRIANMDDGSFVGTFAYYEALKQNAGEQLWLPGHGRPSPTLLADYGAFMAGIYEPSLQTVEEGLDMDVARARVLSDPRVAPHADTMLGFASNIGKYISLAYLEAERIAF